MPRLGPQIDALGRGARIEDVPVVVVEAQPSLTKDQKPYARYLFRDRTGTVRGIRWEHTVEEGEAGAVALVSGSVDEYQGGLQLKVRDLVLVPQPTEELLSRLRAAVDSQLQQTLLAVARRAQAELPATFWQVFEIALGADPFDTSTPFWTWAAAQSKHHSEHGGLAWHVLTMYELAASIAHFYPKLDVDVVKLAVLCHDLGKLDCYQMGAVGARQMSLDRNVGHTAYSIARVLGAIDEIRASGAEFVPADEENLLHCIAAHHGRKEWGAIYEPATPEAAVVNAIDLLDSQARMSDAKAEPLPDRGGVAAAPPQPAPVAKADDDPFLNDDDDPFDEPAPSAPTQPTLF